MLDLLVIVVVSAAAFPPPTCVDLERKTCGYHCVSSVHGAACAKTPEGICVSTPKRNVCWDPPAGLTRLARARRPSCLTSHGDAACGYGCTSAGGALACGDAPGASCHANDGRFECGFACQRSGGVTRCARTPRGACTTVHGRIVCFDPAPELYTAYGDELPQATCASSQDAAACGYNCAARGGEVACAKTPTQACVATTQGIVCFGAPPF